MNELTHSRSCQNEWLQLHRIDSETSSEHGSEKCEANGRNIMAPVMLLDTASSVSDTRRVLESPFHTLCHPVTAILFTCMAL